MGKAKLGPEWIRLHLDLHLYLTHALFSFAQRETFPISNTIFEIVGNGKNVMNILEDDTKANIKEIIHDNVWLPNNFIENHILPWMIFCKLPKYFQSTFFSWT